MKRLLFVTSTRIGDGVLSSGLLDALIAEMGNNGSEEVRVTVACGPLAAPLFEAVPGLERIIVMTKRRRGGHWIDLWKQVAFTAWDTVVDLRRSALVWTLPLVRRRLTLPKETGALIHRVVQIGSVIGRGQRPPVPRLWLTDRHRARAAELIPDGGPVLALGPTANWRAKTWRAERFADLMQRLTGVGGILPGARVALFGGPGERPQAEALIDAVPETLRIDLIGSIDLLTAYACLQRCALYVGNDSALMHLAAAAGIPTLGLFGPSEDAHYAPWGEHCAVQRTTVPFADIYPPGFDHRTSDTLMDTLTVDAAEAAARGLWQRCWGLEAEGRG